MKRFTPFIFPIIVLLIVGFLAWRWYDLRAERAAQRLDFGEGVEIENLTDDERSEVTRGVGDFETVELERPETEEGREPLAGTEMATGVFRYEVRDNRVRFSVMANLPESSEGRYQVWLKEVDGEGVRRAFVLVPGKGGFEGSAAVSAELLPFEVLVTRELSDDDTVEDVILRGRVNKPASLEENAENAS
jgi:hypothetical protein